MRSAARLHSDPLGSYSAPQTLWPLPGRGKGGEGIIGKGGREKKKGGKRRKGKERHGKRRGRKKRVGLEFYLPPPGTATPENSMVSRFLCSRDKGYGNAETKIHATTFWHV